MLLVNFAPHYYLPQHVATLNGLGDLLSGPCPCGRLFVLPVTDFRKTHENDQKECLQLAYNVQGRARGGRRTCIA